jgi:hypothetical protein
LAGAVALGPRALLGQVDHRVNRGNTDTSGYALDRNAQAGSGGFNLTRPGLTGFDSGSTANAVITGNVTGLGGFKGFSPIPQSNAFRTDLPSTGLSGFFGRGVGPTDLRSNRVPTQTYFFDPARTVPDSGQIRQGQNVPGVSRLTNTNLPPVAPATVTPLRPLPSVRDPADQRMQFNSKPAELGITQTQTIKPPRPMPADAVAPSFSDAARSAIFGAAMPGREPARGAPGIDARLDNVRVGQKWSELNQPPEAKTLPPKRGEEKPGTAAREGVEAGGLAAKQVGPQPAEQRAAGPGPTMLPLDGQAPSNLGGDRYADLYSAVRAADQVGVNQFGWQTIPQEKRDTRPPDQGPPIARAGEEMAKLATAAKWARDVLEDPVTTFVGKYENDLNRYMAAGEGALKSGDYYRAARLFDLARLVDPVNPLPQLNRGLALAAAGDYVSSVAALEEGIRRFPQIAAFKLDLIAMVGNRDVFDVRRADLENRLAVREQYDLRFLLGYLEFYSGLPDDGLKNLRKAASAAPAGSPIASFASLLTGEQPMPKIPR